MGKLKDDKAGSHVYSRCLSQRGKMRAGGRRRVVELEAGSTQRRLLLQGDNNMKVKVKVYYNIYLSSLSTQEARL